MIAPVFNVPDVKLFVIEAESPLIEPLAIKEPLVTNPDALRPKQSIRPDNFISVPENVVAFAVYVVFEFDALAVVALTVVAFTLPVVLKLSVVFFSIKFAIDGTVA